MVHRRNMLEVLSILLLMTITLHPTTADEQDESTKMKYKGPVVYSNLPPPVLYFPNFPPKPKIANRGDGQESHIEYVPFPFKDLPLLVYESQSQPPVHVVEKEANPAPDKGSVSKTHQQSNQNAYQTSDYVKNVQQPYPRAQPQILTNSNNYYAANQYTDSQNQGYTTSSDRLPNNVPYSASQQAAPSSPSQQNTVSYQVKGNAGQNNQQQISYTVAQNNAQNPAQYTVVNSVEKQPAQFQNVNPQMNINTRPSQSVQHNVNTQNQPNIHMRPQMQNIQTPQLHYNIQQMQQQQSIPVEHVQNTATQQDNQKILLPSMQQHLVGSNSNLLQHPGTLIATIPQFQKQPNVPPRGIQNRPHIQQPQVATNDGNGQDQEYLSIALYPYDILNTNYKEQQQQQQEQQYYKIVIPSQNDLEILRGSDGSKQMNPANSNLMKMQNQQTHPSQGQNSQHMSISSSQGQQMNQQGPKQPIEGLLNSNSVKQQLIEMQKLQAMGMEIQRLLAMGQLKQQAMETGNPTKQAMPMEMQKQQATVMNLQQSTHSQQYPGMAERQKQQAMRMPKQAIEMEMQKQRMMEMQKQQAMEALKQKIMELQKEKEMERPNLHEREILKQQQTVEIPMEQVMEMLKQQTIQVQKQQMMEMEKQQAMKSENSGFQRIKMGDSSQGGRNVNKQRNIDINTKKQMVREKMNAVDKNKLQKQNSKQEPTENFPGFQDDSVEYQQILIHIPHTLSGQPQIVVQQGDSDQVAASYADTGVRNDTGKLVNAANYFKQPQYEFMDQNYQITRQKPISSEGAISSSYFRQASIPKFSIENPDIPDTSKYLFGKQSSTSPIRNNHPGVYSNSFFYTSSYPYFGSPYTPSFGSPKKNTFRPAYSNPFEYISASASKPSLLQSSYDNIFDTAFANGEILAEASFQSPAFIHNPHDMLGKGMSHSVYPGHKIIKPGQNARPIFNAHQIPNYAKLTYPGPVRINAGHPMLLNNPFMPFPQQPIPGNRNIPLNSAVPKGNGKYGNFIKKLTTLSSMFLSQSLGMKSQISPREETKVANEYTVEEIDDVPEAILSGSSTIKRQGLSAKDPKPEWSRRISKPDDIPRPPIIVYKGAKPPVEVYGTKDDIEKAKDPLETSASEHKATISIEGSEIEDDLDFMKDLYTILPKHVKRSIANEMEEEDQLDLKDSETKNESLDDEEDSSPSEVSEDNGQKIKESEDNDALKSSTPDDKSTFAIEEDIEELVKLLHKEEKSDIFQM